jgi:hypothetical protein
VNRVPLPRKDPRKVEAKVLLTGISSEPLEGEWGRNSRGHGSCGRVDERLRQEFPGMSEDSSQCVGGVVLVTDGAGKALACQVAASGAVNCRPRWQ